MSALDRVDQDESRQAMTATILICFNECTLQVEINSVFLDQSVPQINLFVSIRKIVVEQQTYEASENCELLCACLTNPCALLQPG